MNCRIVELKDKQVICIKDGTVLGFVGDIEVDTGSGRLVSIVIYGRSRFFGIAGREDDCVIPWEEIEVIGDDSILVRSEPPRIVKRGRNPFGGFTYGSGK